ncbi:MAG: right-handed parallel beta-helix repeat-containing protein, partial [Thermoplasmata archaeon]|nr:right-handed parallel beta-helix repeat-containing protein [Thermoplasmata archaeon]
DWLVMVNSTFTMRNSFVYDCGEYAPGPIVDDGLVINTNRAIIAGTNISDGGYGIIAVGVRALFLHNVTVSDCEIGLYMVGIRDSQVKTCKFLNNNIYGVQMRGFFGNVQFESSVMAGNGQANLYMGFRVNGFSNTLINCTIGPGGQVGMYLEEIFDWDIIENSIIGCQIGVDIKAGEIDLVNNKVSDCALGVNIIGDAVIRLDDLHLTNTSIDVDTEPRVDITALTNIRWEDVTGNLACVLETAMNGKFELENCQLSFKTRQGEPGGLRATRLGTMNIYNSTIDSPFSGEWIGQMDDGSRVEFKWTTFLNLGTLKMGPQEMGLFIGGSGTVEEIEVRDSIVGLVIGRAKAYFNNITIRDCQTGLVTDGALGIGGADIHGLLIERCNEAVVARSDGSLSVTEGAFHLGTGTGFNLSRSTIYIRDCWVSAPAPGELT